MHVEPARGHLSDTWVRTCFGFPLLSSCCVDCSFHLSADRSCYLQQVEISKVGKWFSHHTSRNMPGPSTPGHCKPHQDFKAAVATDVSWSSWPWFPSKPTVAGRGRRGEQPCSTSLEGCARRVASPGWRQLGPGTADPHVTNAPVEWHPLEESFEVLEQPKGAASGATPPHLVDWAHGRGEHWGQNVGQ